MGQGPTLRSLDHLVLTVADIPRTVAFYRGVLGMEPAQFTPADGSTRWALRFGDQKINLHQAGREFEPKAAHAGPGTADLCFLTEVPLTEWQAHLKRRVWRSKTAQCRGRARRGRSCRSICATRMEI